MELGRNLSDHRFLVKGVRLSKEERMFEGQEGAANFYTDSGAFEVLFISKPETFAAMEIVEHQKGTGSYIYSFRGSPRLPDLEGGRQYFIKHGSLLLHTLDKQVAVKLEEAFQSY
jgi:hypothetical protein